MKKKILLSLLVILTLLTIVGCSNDKDTKKSPIDNGEVVIIEGEKYNLKSSQSLKDLHFKENYVDFRSDVIGNIKTMTYTKQEKLIFEVRVMYDENRSISESKAIIETKYGVKEQSKEINGIKYIYYEYQDDALATVHHYMYVHKGIVYSIGFFLGENYGNIEEVFMNNISFE